ncbi:FadR/GntR family transcriptional regulator [Comamonas testosteroni]|uniref:FadR/GntR family transcriptional regulator n=1 Tax=Comamonas testosteroni TaxID=285 RepID=UPI00389A54C2
MDNAAILKDAILEKLETGQWPPGHRIDTERQLSEVFQIGRSTVRRVLAQLKTAGLITQTVGSGTYVSESYKPGGALQGNASAHMRETISPAELMDFRFAMEPGILDLVVRNATQNDFAVMLQCCEKAESAQTMEEFEVWDGKLHDAIATAAHNTMVTNVFRLINQARLQDDWGALKRHSLTDKRRLAYQEEHRQLVNALIDRDLMLAIEYTRTHLLHVRRNLLGA